MNKIIVKLTETIVIILIIMSYPFAYNSKAFSVESPKIKGQSKINIKNSGKQNALLNSYIELKKLPKNYSVSMARRNGDIVSAHSKNYNIEKLEKFLKNVKSKIPDMIRVTIFNDEGNAIIQDIIFKNNVISLTIDGRRDMSEVPIKKYTLSGVYKSFHNNIIYYYAKSNKGVELPLIVE
jgi:hypothetical protein